MNIREKMKEGKPLIGTFVNLQDTVTTEIMASLGYDYIWVDAEHMPYSPYDVYRHVLAAHAHGTAVFVRVPVDDLTFTKHVLEMDIDGIIFPMIKNAEHVKELFENTLYPPIGKRGCGPRGAVNYGLGNESEFYKTGQFKLCRFIQIEQKSAVDDIDEIMKIPYLDGCILGLYDLSGSIGIPGEVFSDKTLSLAKLTVEKCLEKQKYVGIPTFATDEKTLNFYKDMGINMICTGADYDYVLKGARETINKASKVWGK